MEARHRGEDIIDFGMGNPDQPTPKHIVEKLVEASQRDDTHGYSISKGIPVQFPLVGCGPRAAVRTRPRPCLINTSAAAAQ